MSYRATSAPCHPLCLASTIDKSHDFCGYALTVPWFVRISMDESAHRPKVVP